MLARAFAAILPPLTEHEALETASIYSAAGLLSGNSDPAPGRPFRAPHHSVSHAGLVGGGSPPRPGEVSLAHNGVLFLDEMAEFGGHALDLLREPMEDGHVTVVRARGSVRFPARFSLVGAKNPCRCGHDTTARVRCTCSISEKRRYAARLSGPLLDRIDIRLDVPRMSYRDIACTTPGERSTAIRDRVRRAREIQIERSAARRLRCRSNASLPAARIEETCSPDRSGRKLLERIVDGLGLSARGYARLLMVARTIADLEGCDRVEEPHLAEAAHLSRPAGEAQGR
jgi:magnesium chelatase family protein